MAAILQTNTEVDYHCDRGDGGVHGAVLGGSDLLPLVGSPVLVGGDIRGVRAMEATANVKWLRLLLCACEVSDCKPCSHKQCAIILLRISIEMAAFSTEAILSILKAAISIEIRSNNDGLQ